MARVVAPSHQALVAKFYLAQAAVFVVCAAGGSALATALRLFILEPGPDTTFELWKNVTIGQTIFVVALGLPLALLGLALARRLFMQVGPRRPLLLAIEVAAGLLYLFLVIGGPITSFPPISSVIVLLPWIVFGLVARMD